MKNKILKCILGNKIFYGVFWGIFLDVILFMFPFFLLSKCADNSGCLVIALLPLLPVGIILNFFDLPTTGAILVISFLVFYFLFGFLLGLIVFSIKSKIKK